MFQFPAFAPCKNRVTALQAAGLSHSEIDGSKDICSYPSLFAAYHVLHRLCEPRHPPCALYYFLAARCLLTCHHNMKPAVTEDVSLLSFFYLQSCFVLCQYVKDLFTLYQKQISAVRKAWGQNWANHAPLDSCHRYIILRLCSSSMLNH